MVVSGTGFGVFGGRVVVAVRLGAWGARYGAQGGHCVCVCVCVCVRARVQVHACASLEWECVWPGDECGNGLASLGTCKRL